MRYLRRYGRTGRRPIIGTVLGSRAVSYVAAADRYDAMHYRRCGRSGCAFPRSRSACGTTSAMTDRSTVQRDICRRAFDLGITHFDLANNYGPPYGAAEENFGRILATDFAGHRDELVISTKAGYDMWPGPYGERGSRKYLLASLDQSLRRLGLDYVDIFYSHRFDPDTPLDETVGALASGRDAGQSAVCRDLVVLLGSHRRGRSSARTSTTSRCSSISRRTRCSTAGSSTTVCSTRSKRSAPAASPSHRSRRACSPTATCTASRPTRAPQQAARCHAAMITEERLANVRALADIAERRGQSLAQLALAWALRDPRMTSLVIGASSVAQLERQPRRSR